MRPSQVLALALAALAPGVGRAELKDYLTKDGKLTAPLEVHDMYSGGLGVSGWKVTVDTDGSWTVTQTFGEKGGMERKGKLTKKQVAALAKELDRYGAATLKGARPFKGANPRNLTVKFG